MDYDEILYEVEHRIATVTLNRPTKLNAWTPVMEKSVRAAMMAAEADEGVRVIVLTGAGRGFCAGADMQSLSSAVEAQLSTDQVREWIASNQAGESRSHARPDFQTAYSYFPAISKPILAAINGPVAGLGLVLALYCDIRFASDEARFSTAFSRRGLIAEYGMSWMLPRLVGLSSALDLLYSSRMIDAHEALRMGLVSRVVPHDELLREVHSYANELATMVSPRSLRVIKRQVYEAQLQSLGEAIDSANDEMAKSFTCEDFREGVAHFLEKRPPNFTGK